eukprot:5075455-Pleurochrysis_carterae.AAC.3
MSRSLHPSVSAAARRASRSSCLAPENRVSLVDASTGWQSEGQRSPTPCRVPTLASLPASARPSAPMGPSRPRPPRARRAATAAAAGTPGRKRASIGTGPSGLAQSSAPRPRASVTPRGLLLSGRALRSCPLRRLAVGSSAGWVSSSPLGIGSAASSALPAGARLRSDAKAGGLARAAATQAWMDGVRRGPSATLPP